jgi:hypothetical protein
MLQASVVVPICPLPVLLQPIRREGETMWTLMTTALLHCCPNPRRDSDDTMPALLLPQARNKSHGGTSIAHTSASKKKRGVTIHCLTKMRMTLIVAMRRTTRRGIITQ